MNPYQASARAAIIGVECDVPRSWTERLARKVSLLSAALSLAGVAAILVMFSWIDESHGVASLTNFMIVAIWMGAPYFALAGVALLLRRSLVATIAVLGTALTNDFLSTSFIYLHWQHFFRPADPDMITMNCGPPPELYLPMLQWIVVAMTTAFAFAVWRFAAYVSKD